MGYSNNFELIYSFSFKVLLLLILAQKFSVAKAGKIANFMIRIIFLAILAAFATEKFWSVRSRNMEASGILGSIGEAIAI